MEPVRRAVAQVLTGHEPFPAAVVDRWWNLVAANRNVSLFLEGVAPHLLEPPANVLRVSLHPDGMAPRIVNLAEWRGHLLDRLRREVAATADARLAELLGGGRGLPAPRGVRAAAAAAGRDRRPARAPPRRAASCRSSAPWRRSAPPSTSPSRSCRSRRSSPPTRTPPRSSTNHYPRGNRHASLWMARCAHDRTHRHHPHRRRRTAALRAAARRGHHRRQRRSPISPLFWLLDGALGVPAAFLAGVGAFLVAFAAFVGRLSRPALARPRRGDRRDRRQRAVGARQRAAARRGLVHPHRRRPGRRSRSRPFGVAGLAALQYAGLRRA